MHIIFQFSFMLESGTGHKTALHGHVGIMHVFLSCFNFVVFCLMVLRYSLPCLSLILCVRQPRLYPPLSYHPPVILFVDFSPNPCNEACIYGLDNNNISNAVEFSMFPSPFKQVLTVLCFVVDPYHKSSIYIMFSN